MNMRVLIVHNDYGKYSGEEAVVDKMAAMLRSHGYEVAFYRLTSAGSRESLGGKVHGFAAGIYSPSGVRGMREALRRERPDVVNVHNLYPFISPAALRECSKAGVPVVMTVHNFRLVCPTGLFMRDGRPCELCLRRGGISPQCDGLRLHHRFPAAETDGSRFPGRPYLRDSQFYGLGADRGCPRRQLCGLLRQVEPGEGHRHDNGGCPPPPRNHL